MRRWITGIAMAALCACATQIQPLPETTPSPQPQTTVTPTASAAPSASPPPATTPTPAPTATRSADAVLWDALRTERGLVILMRHAQTPPGTGDPPGFKLDDCTTQRNLSDAGRAQAAVIGQRLRDEAVDVVLVATSQYCRCLDTAKLLGLARVEPWPDLNSIFEERSRADAQTEAIRDAIRSRRGQSGVLVLVTHQVNITALTKIVPPQGGLVIVRARDGSADSVLEVLGQLRISP